MDNATRTRIDLERALRSALEVHPATAESRAIQLSYDTRYAQGIDAAARGNLLVLLGVVADELRDEEQRVASYRQQVASWRRAADELPTNLDEDDFAEALAALGEGKGMHLAYAEERLAGRRQEWNEVSRLAAQDATKRLLARGGGRLTVADLGGKVAS